ncbi:MAG TPA: hypothetical protein VL986_11270 [Terracidiphilus sp.]|nr:hypothetical protein [Terracidiphilus sp.]
MLPIGYYQREAHFHRVDAKKGIDGAFDCINNLLNSKEASHTDKVTMKTFIFAVLTVLLTSVCWGQDKSKLGTEKELPANCSWGMLSLSDVSAEHRFNGSFCGLLDTFVYQNEAYISVTGFQDGEDSDGKPTKYNVWNQHGKNWNLEVLISWYDNGSKFDMQETMKGMVDGQIKRGLKVLSSEFSGNAGLTDDCYLRRKATIKWQAPAGNMVYEKLIIDSDAALIVLFTVDAKDNTMDDYAQNVLNGFQGRPYAYRKECGPVPAN